MNLTFKQYKDLYKYKKNYFLFKTPFIIFLSVSLLNNNDKKLLNEFCKQRGYKTAYASKRYLKPFLKFNDSTLFSNNEIWILYPYKKISVNEYPFFFIPELEKHYKILFLGILFEHVLYSKKFLNKISLNKEMPSTVLYNLSYLQNLLKIRLSKLHLKI